MTPEMLKYQIAKVLARQDDDDEPNYGHLIDAAELMKVFDISPRTSHKQGERRE